MKRASPLPDLDGLIFTVRNQPVILDRDLARLYEVATFRFNEAVKRNADRFPADFRFRLSPKEWAAAKQQNLSAEHGGGGTEDAPANSSQNAMSSAKHRGAAYLPWAFTEHGAIMAATVLKSRRAVWSKSDFSISAKRAARVAHEQRLPPVCAIFIRKSNPFYCRRL